MAAAFTIPFRDKGRPAPGSKRGPATYALPPEERLAQSEKVAELRASGRV